MKEAVLSAATDCRPASSPCGAGGGRLSPGVAQPQGRQALGSAQHSFSRPLQSLLLLLCNACTPAPAYPCHAHYIRPCWTNVSVTHLSPEPVVLGQLLQEAWHCCGQHRLHHTASCSRQPRKAHSAHNPKSNHSAACTLVAASAACHGSAAMRSSPPNCPLYATFPNKWQAQHPPAALCTQQCPSSATGSPVFSMAPTGRMNHDGTSRTTYRRTHTFRHQLTLQHGL